MLHPARPKITIAVFVGFFFPFWGLGWREQGGEKEKGKKIDYFQLVIHLICSGSDLPHSQLPLVNLIREKFNYIYQGYSIHSSYCLGKIGFQC